MMHSKSRIAFELILSIVSVLLGIYLELGVYSLMSGAVAEQFPEAAVLLEAGQYTKFLDALAGALLIGWPIIWLSYGEPLKTK